jgi:hypothetical protein
LHPDRPLPGGFDSGLSCRLHHRVFLVRRMKLPDYWAVHGPPDGYDWRDNRLIAR